MVSASAIQERTDAIDASNGPTSPWAANSATGGQPTGPKDRRHQTLHQQATIGMIDSRVGIGPGGSHQQLATPRDP